MQIAGPGVEEEKVNVGMHSLEYIQYLDQLEDVRSCLPKTCSGLPARRDNPPTRDVANTHPQVRHSPSPRAYAKSNSPHPARCSNKRRTLVQDPDEAMQERIKRLRIANRCDPSPS